MKEDEFAWKLFSAGIEVASANGQTHTPKAKVELKRSRALGYYIDVFNYRAYMRHQNHCR